MSKSLIAYIISIAIVLGSGLIYYPKWKFSGTEATLSWDVAGYYFYLPAFFIHENPKNLPWKDEILQKYNPGGSYQSFLHESGHQVMKYSCGMAVQYSPAFLAGHLIALSTSHAADGFSRPYQVAISLGSLLIACLGLWLLRIVLCRYFADGVTGLILITIAIGTNYLDYAGMNHAMTHNYLFTLYAALILLSDNYWKRPRMATAVGIGAIAGLMALTRPSELVAILIPILWGIDNITHALKARLYFFRGQWRHFVTSGIAFMLIALLQPIYWKFATGEWIVYSYEEQGFSWLSPHIADGLFSYRAGWLVYTPVMLLVFPGFYYLYKQHKSVFYPALVTSVIFMYITWAWDIWWYGGSLGQRAMVQLYPVLAFPLAACISRAISSHWKYILIGFLLICLYYNLWLTHQAHRGGLFRAGEMNQAYFWHILGKYQVAQDAEFLLDNQESYKGNSEGTVILSTGFEEGHSVADCPVSPVSGANAICAGPGVQPDPIIFTFAEDTQWIRAEATFRGTQKEWDIWKMTQFVVHLRNAQEHVKTQIIRVHRVLQDGDTLRCALDIKVPQGKNLTQGEVQLVNVGSPTWLAMDDLTVTVFQ